jgi:hypothetical protein
MTLEDYESARARVDAHTRTHTHTHTLHNYFYEIILGRAGDI